MPGFEPRPRCIPKISRQTRYPLKHAGTYFHTKKKKEKKVARLKKVERSRDSASSCMQVIYLL